MAALNKIDLPAADPDRCAAEIERVLGLPATRILRISAKTGEGVDELLDAVDRADPGAQRGPGGPAPGAHLRLGLRPVPRRGQLDPGRRRDPAGPVAAPLHAGRRGPRRRGDRASGRPATVPVDELGPGEVGYLFAGIKDVGEARSGETVTDAAAPAAEPLAGYRDPKPMVFCGLYPIDGDELPDLRDALEKLKLNDASFTFEPESSRALGFGFRCGFLGLLHMEIVRERLEREFDLSLIATAPSVAYRASLHRRRARCDIDNPTELPEASQHRPHRRADAHRPPS